jgi:transcriptional regulator with XRE-family HTH domain
MMKNRVDELMKAGLTRQEIADFLCCHASHVSRLRLGRCNLTPLQSRVLDHLADSMGLPHLTAAQFASAAATPPIGAAPGASAAPSDFSPEGAA